MVNKEVVNDSKVVAKAFEGKNIGPGDSERRVQKDVNLQRLLLFQERGCHAFLPPGMEGANI